MPIAVETLLPSPPPLQQMGPVEITANLNSAHNSSSSSSSSSSDAMTSSDSSYSLSSSYADDTGLDKFMLTSELNNAHSCEHHNNYVILFHAILRFTVAVTANQDSVVISDHSYFKIQEPSTDHGENEEASKRKKGRPRKYNVESPKTQTKLSFNSNKASEKSNSPIASQNTSTADTPNIKTPTRTGRKYQRRNNCGKCQNCQRQDCGKCRNCLDKPKFGGRNTKKQRCIERICIHREHYVSCTPLVICIIFDQIAKRVLYTRISQMTLCLLIVAKSNVYIRSLFTYAWYTGISIIAYLYVCIHHNGRHIAYSFLLAVCG